MVVRCYTCTGVRVRGTTSDEEDELTGLGLPDQTGLPAVKAPAFHQSSCMGSLPPSVKEGGKEPEDECRNSSRLDVWAHGVLSSDDRLPRRCLSSRIRLSVRMSKAINKSRSGGRSRGTNISWMAVESPFRNTSYRAVEFHPLSAANVRKWMAWSLTELLPCFSPLSSLAFSWLVVTGSKVLTRASLNSLREAQSGDSRSHSAVAHTLARLVRCEIMKAILDRSVGNAKGECSK